LAASIREIANRTRPVATWQLMARAFRDILPGARGHMPVHVAPVVGAGIIPRSASPDPAGDWETRGSTRIEKHEWSSPARMASVPIPLCLTPFRLVRHVQTPEAPLLVLALASRVRG